MPCCCPPTERLGSATPLAVVTHDGVLNVDDSYQQTYAVQIPDAQDGDYQVLVVTDFADVVYERDGDDNNWLAAPDSVAVTHPDLVPESLQVPSTPISGSQISIGWSIANQGSGDTMLDWWEHVYLSQDEVLDGSDQLLAEVHVIETLVDGGQLPVEQLVTLPLEVSGTYWFIVVSDATDRVRELADEDNNILSATATIDLAPFADLVTSDVEAPSLTIDDPATVEVSWTVTNAGTGIGKTANWTDAIIASSDAIVGNGDDRVLGRFAHQGSLDVGQQYMPHRIVAVATGVHGQVSTFCGQ